MEGQLVLVCKRDCKLCGGVGATMRKEIAPGHSPRFGGSSPSITRRQLCSCVVSANDLKRAVSLTEEQAEALAAWSRCVNPHGRGPVFDAAHGVAIEVRKKLEG